MATSFSESHSGTATYDSALSLHIPHLKPAVARTDAADDRLPSSPSGRRHYVAVGPRDPSTGSSELWRFLGIQMLWISTRSPGRAAVRTPLSPDSPQSPVSPDS